MTTSRPDQPAASLVEIAGGRIYVLGEQNTIGRDPSCTVHIDDMMAAKRHAEIRRDGDRWVLVDLGSRHGTYVGGKRVTGEVVLANGDEILIAGARLRFELTEPKARTATLRTVTVVDDPMSPLVTRRLSAWTAQMLIPAAELAGLEALTRGHEKLRALVQVSRTLGVEHDPTNLLEKLLDAVFDIVPAERGAIVVVDPVTGELGWQVSRGAGGSRRPVEIPNTLVTEVMTQASGVLTVDAEIDERFARSQSIAAAGIRSAMCVPLMWRGSNGGGAGASPGTGSGQIPLDRKGEILGILYVDSRNAVGAFGDDDLELLTSVGGQAALALKNALLVQRVREVEAGERRKLEGAIALLPAAMIVLDADARIVLVNPLAEQLLPALGTARVGDTLGTVAGEPLAKLTERAGDRVIGSRVFAVTTATGEGGLAVLSFRDVTDERARQAQLAHEERLALLGRVAGGIAHEFNNLLAVIINYTDFARDRADGGRVADDLEHVRDAATRMTALTRQLLAFGRREVIRPQILDLNTHVSSVDEMLRRTFGPNIVVHTRLGKHVPPIKVDPTQLEQVVANLVVNARDALEGAGGELTIETGVVDLDATLAHRYGDIAPGRYAELVVADTGVGMSRDVMARIFEPFFTTKDRLHGSGLGLATVHGIVRRAGGGIIVDSEPGRGSRFRVFLPASREAMPAVVPAPAPSHATILIAEDQPAVLGVIQRVLGRAGYRLLAASCGADALEVAARHDGPIDLLLTDVIMPGMSGRELAEKMRVARPGIRILFVSGHVADEDRDGVAGSSFLAKPFTSKELLEQTREILGEKPKA